MRLLVFVLSFLPLIAAAGTVTIDFDNALENRVDGTLVSIQEDGYTVFLGWGNEYLHLPGQPDQLVYGGASTSDIVNDQLFVCHIGYAGLCSEEGSYSFALIVADNGGTFDLHSMDIGGREEGLSDRSAVFSYRENCGSVCGDFLGATSLSPYLGFEISAPSTTVDFSGSNWSDLTEVVIYAPVAELWIDNIVVSQVPVPPALWLFGSALAGLSWLRRK